jgi:hypothetical protein
MAFAAWAISTAQAREPATPPEDARSITFFVPGVS